VTLTGERPLRPVPSAVLFDCDGTLADSMRLIETSIAEALSVLGHSFTHEQVHAIAGPPFRDMIRLLVGRTTDEEFARIGDAYGAAYNERQAEMLRPIAGATPLIEALRTRDIPLALVTNRIEASAHRAITTLGWAQHFDVVIGSDMTAQPKPSADPALLALERLGVHASLAAYVGDNEADMLCATAAGIPVVIGLAIAGNGDALAAAGATYVAGSLEEVEAVLMRGDSICA
jgi:HAD superfamily hydrolase (TIGR01509 family)